ncbi:hypothetical protein ACVKXF_000935 [Curtobacterium sp. PvP017]|uniref:Uncharacterized protein n=1 Tax=Curtobacterium citreum TaxID=2036 RepID=A0ABU8Y6Z8_9MICO|nr:hypothetical protein [Curtobacterium sp. JUb34]
MSDAGTMTKKGRGTTSTRRVALMLGAALIAGIGMTATAEPAHAGPIGLMPDCSNRKAVQIKTTGLTMNTWFYKNDRKKISSGKYRWSYRGEMYTLDVGRQQWISAGSTSHTCTGK